MSRSAHGPIFLSVFLLLSVFSASAAYAVQTGGSISLFPTDFGFLNTGDHIEVVVQLNNTSTDTPGSDFPDGVDPVPAQLTGAITVLLACVDPECSSQASGKLMFEGCTDLDPAVASCSAGGSNAVVIQLKAAGITIPGTTNLATNNVDVATIKLKVLDAEGFPTLGLMAMTDPVSLRACSSSTPSICASCEASGCTTLVFKSGIPVSCPHACPERIIFRGDAETPDLFEFHALISAPSGLDPPNEVFSVSLSNALFDPMLSFSLPSGSFIKQGAGTYTYTNPQARNTGGIGFVKISERDNMPNVFKIDIQAFDASLQTEATVPTMTVRFAIGNDPFETTNNWTKQQNGWTLNLPK